ncbi:DUF423 domain-containing protein [Cohnella lupini]|uniref:Uncharacterized membrane protein YgdD (TMEM256/DUF423 family) n=1 Tax=Cohnella lupini TaxID=1294267 RepID=A0A3D9IQE7_9BACL|nr:DUF423 domain-containing protein [Cohnella lupini]RED64014.1 uncharacterized membrane protein YgdD (TMEM256/DUF423 family) [Cohnella lupini]
MNKYTKIGAFAAMLSVVFGAFGAHMLEDSLTADALDVYETAVQYHMFHSIGILLIALLMDRLPSQKLAVWAARLLLIGIVLFSGSLYALALSDVKLLGAITPIGGVAFIAGWICMALAARPAK